MNEFPGLIAGQVWQHTNGFKFRVLDLSYLNDCEPHAPVVIHQGLHDGRVWVRCVENFVGRNADGELRFTFVEFLQTDAG
jgi:hypothetical protein